jgi:hypothetical protein
MKLFIQIRDGQPFEHPIMEDNFYQAFPHISPNDLPPQFAHFERIEPPNNVGVYEIAEVSYQWVDGIVKDVWTIRNMTAAERDQKTQYLTGNAMATVEHLKGIAQNGIDTSVNDEVKQLWVDYLAALNAWTLVDPANPDYPRAPDMQPNGTNLSTFASGSAPNVIG